MQDGRRARQGRRAEGKADSLSEAAAGDQGDALGEFGAVAATGCAAGVKGTVVATGGDAAGAVSPAAARRRPDDCPRTRQANPVAPIRPPSLTDRPQASAVGKIAKLRRHASENASASIPRGDLADLTHP
jgi:hypothetical protein